MDYPAIVIGFKMALLQFGTINSGNSSGSIRDEDLLKIE
jgi:hypothetical protein